MALTTEELDNHGQPRKDFTNNLAELSETDFTRETKSKSGYLPLQAITLIQTAIGCQEPAATKRTVATLPTSTGMPSSRYHSNHGTLNSTVKWLAEMSLFKNLHPHPARPFFAPQLAHRIKSAAKDRKPESQTMKAARRGASFFCLVYLPS
jgi:hypothetical protein